MGLIPYRRFCENADFEREHPRVPSGLEEGGEFTKKEIGYMKSSLKQRKFNQEKEQEIVRRYNNGEHRCLVWRTRRDRP